MLPIVSYPDMSLSILEGSYKSRLSPAVDEELFACGCGSVITLDGSDTAGYVLLRTLRSVIVNEFSSYLHFVLNVSDDLDSDDLYLEVSYVIYKPQCIRFEPSDAYGEVRFSAYIEAAEVHTVYTFSAGNVLVRMARELMCYREQPVVFVSELDRRVDSSIICEPIHADLEQIARLILWRVHKTG